RFAGHGAAPRPMVSTGAFLNYDVSADHVAGATSTGGFLELGAFGTQGVVTGTMIARDSDGQRNAIRLDTSWTRDFPDRLSTMRVGDAISSSGAWGRSVRFGGIQFGTNFRTRPTLVTTPLLAVSGEAVVPSTVDVFVNGQRLASEQLAPGPFTIEHLPSINGAGQLQVVVVDALGRQQVVAQPYYTGTALLRAGLDEWSVEIGGIREDYGRRSGRYGDLVGSATLRRGLTNRLTAEVHAEAQADGSAATGMDAAWRLGTVGILSATLASGKDDDGSGWLAGLGFERSGPRLSAFARTQYAAAGFARIGGATEAKRARQLSFLGLGWNLLRHGSLQLAFGQQTFWDSPAARTVGLTYSRSLGDLGFLSLFANHGDGTDRQTELLASWTKPFGRGRSTSTSLRHTSDGGDGDRFEAVTAVQQNLPAGPGSGYSLTISTSDDHRAGYAYQGRAGTASLDYASEAGQAGWRVGALGGVAVTAAGVMPARRLDDGFAVIQVADYEGLEVRVDNQPAGRTDRKGRLLLDRLRAYEANEVSLEPTELPMDAVLSDASIEVTPAFRSGALVRFPVTRGDAVVMRLVQPGGQPVPAGAVVIVGAAEFPVALKGLVQVNGVTGNARAVASWQGSRCAFEIERPAGDEPLPDLGEIPCSPSDDGATRP
ncbi:MAG TPA: fimbria/pilus outer membrane usher protein, partial [Pseudomonadales bacterium]|nr:fimbria/pilus outer membrane usher protein [Pseudomonadales bacterium]